MDIRTGDIHQLREVVEEDDPIRIQELAEKLGVDIDKLKAMKVPPTPEQLRRTPDHPKAIGRVGRNDPCPCGSDLKFKNCCKT